MILTAMPAPIGQPGFSGRHRTIPAGVLGLSLPRLLHLLAEMLRNLVLARRRNHPIASALPPPLLDQLGLR